MPAPRSGASPGRAQRPCGGGRGTGTERITDGSHRSADQRADPRPDLQVEQRARHPHRRRIHLLPARPHPRHASGPAPHRSARPRPHLSDRNLGAAHVDHAAPAGPVRGSPRRARRRLSAGAPPRARAARPAGPLNRLLAPGSEEELEGIVDELVRAALLISEAKHGALIVLERATGLQDYSETGVPVNGKLTAELLASIFMTRSPLHDGAVIVRGGQILAAACLLPLEENTDRGAHRYGMRHRAALSISAQTDAIVVVVSEETQAISIAAGGRIIGALDEERLRRVLSSLLRSRIQPLPFRSKAS